MKIIFLLLLFSHLLAHADSREQINNLISSGFSCREKVVSNCAYTECNGKISPYPRPVYFAVPKEFSFLRVHFHGHLLNLASTTRYEGPPAEMVKGFDLEARICLGNEIVIIPSSTGKNDTYKSYFVSAQSWKSFITSLTDLLKLKNSRLHLSGHSGGGKYVALAIANQVVPHRVSVYDGVYSEETLRSIEAFHAQAEAPVLLTAVTKQSPDRFISSLIDRLGISGVKMVIGGTSFTSFSNSTFRYLRRLESGSMAHFTIVTETWGL